MKTNRTKDLYYWIDRTDRFLLKWGPPAAIVSLFALAVFCAALVAQKLGYI